MKIFLLFMLCLFVVSAGGAVGVLVAILVYGDPAKKVVRYYIKKIRSLTNNSK